MAACGSNKQAEKKEEEVDERVVVVSGANSGIGLATVKRILKEFKGTYVFLGSRSEDRGKKAVEEVEKEEGCKGRVALLKLDITNAESIKSAVAAVKKYLGDKTLYGLVNNAGVGEGEHDWVVQVNYFGTRDVCAAFKPLMAKGSRIVNVSSASGPMFVSRLLKSDDDTIKGFAAKFTDLKATLKEADACSELFCDPKKAKEEANKEKTANPFGQYGLSKALVNVLTIALKNENADFVVNGCTPGWIDTKLAAPMRGNKSAKDAGMKTPHQGATASLHLLFNKDVENNGWFYGSDAVRSPLHKYRDPGAPAYDGK